MTATLDITEYNLSPGTSFKQRLPAASLVKSSKCLTSHRVELPMKISPIFDVSEAVAAADAMQ
jgi:hypothetical protein